MPLHGWLLCPRKGAPRGSVLFLHGNAENISTHVRGILWIVDAGYEVFAFDYRGYGRSEGKPDIPGVHRDARAAAAKLLSLPGSPRTGTSCSGSRSAGDRRPHRRDLPGAERPAALIVDSAFAGYSRIVRDKLKETVVTWPFAWPGAPSTATSTARSGGSEDGPRPRVVIHGTADGIVPYEHGRILYGAKDPKGFWTVEGGSTSRTVEPRGSRAVSSTSSEA